MNISISFLQTTLVPLIFFFSLASMALGLVFHKKYFTFFYIGLVGIALIIYAWGLINIFSPGIGSPRKHSLNEIAYNIFWLTAFDLAVYGFIGLVVSGIRRLFKYPVRRFFMYSLIIFSIGTLGIFLVATTPRPSFPSTTFQLIR